MTNTVYHRDPQAARRIERLERLLADLTGRYGPDHPLTRQVAENLETAKSRERLDELDDRDGEAA